MDDHAPETGSLSTYRAVLARRKWIIILSVLLVPIAAVALTYLQKPKYKAVATLTYQQQSSIAQSLMGVSSSTDSTYIANQLATAANLIPADANAAQAAKLLGADAADASALAKTVSAAAVANTNIVNVTATSPVPHTAAVVANAFATAFVNSSKATAVAQLNQALAYTQSKLAAYTTPAQRANPTYTSLVYQLQNLRLLRSVTTGNYQLAQAATTPLAPYTPRRKLDAALGLAIGLLLGIGLASLAEQLDVRVHNADDFAELLGLPILGRIPRFSRRTVQSGQLPVLADPSGVSAEAFRMLRSDLDFVSVDAKVSSMLITSCTQGEGKTSTVCNLGVTLARAGKRVIIVDADLRRSKVHSYFDLPNTVGLSTVISGRTELQDAVHSIPLPVVDDTAAGNDEGMRWQADRLRVITSGPLPPNPGEIVTSKRLASLIQALTQWCDLVLVDAPPFFAVGDAAALSADVDGVLLAMKMEHVTKPMIKEAREWLEHAQCRKLGIVVTNYSLGGGSGYGYSYYRHYHSEAPAPQATQPPAGRSAAPGTVPAASAGAIQGSEHSLEQDPI